MSLVDQLLGVSGSGLLRSLGSSETVRDFRHASKLFVANNYELAPKYGWLYHVFFKINPNVMLRGMPLKNIEAGMLVKNVDLPKFKTNSKTLNAYNKKQIILGKIEYEPVQLILHDDSANVVRDMWRDYLRYYWRDGDNDITKFPLKNTYDTRRTDKWGFTPQQAGSAENFFTSIDIYSMSNKKFSKYELVNPKIDSFAHGKHDASQGTATLEHSMSISYESVIYSNGSTNGGKIDGFGREHYDTQPSPLSPLGGGTKSITGPGGLINAAGDLADNISSGNFGAAALGALRLGKNLQGFDFKAVAKGEIQSAVGGSLRNTASGPFNFPTPTTFNVGNTITKALPSFNFKTAPVSGNFTPPPTGD